MPPTGVVTARLTNTQGGVWSEVTARPRPRCVDRTAHCNPHLAFQRTATRQGRVGAAHAPDALCDRHGQGVGHTVRHAAGQLGDMKIDAQPGTAGSARAAMVNRFSHARRSIS